METGIEYIKLPQIAMTEDAITIALGQRNLSEITPVSEEKSKLAMSGIASTIPRKVIVPPRERM